MESIRFTLNGERYELSLEDVRRRLRGVRPDAVQQHSVEVDGVRFPVKQAFAVATGLPSTDFTSHTARRHLRALGIPTYGAVVARPFRDAGEIGALEGALRAGGAPPARPDEWTTEANVQAAVVTALASQGFRIRSVADTATRERGVDIVALRGTQTVGVEVKGYPSRTYADPRRAHEPKPTRPSTQAGHWYAQAVLAAMRLRHREPGWRSAIALPDAARYRKLYVETRSSLLASEIEVWWVADSGDVVAAEVES